MNELQIFTNDDLGTIRTITIDGEPWFVGKDVATNLGYGDTDQALRRHVDNEDKLTRQIDGSGQNRDMCVINESGVYSLIFSSKLPDAKKFKRWVTHEVLPAIRKTGGYGEKFELAKLIASCKNSTAVKGIMSLYGLSSSDGVEYHQQAKTQYESVTGYLESVERWELTAPPSKRVYEDYVAYCRENHIPSLTKSGFSKQLHKAVGLVIQRRRVDGELVSFYN